MSKFAQDNVARAKGIALRMLARREHSAHEFIQKLQAKDVDSELAHQLLNQFIENDWLSDDRYAEMLARTRKSRGFGPVRIQRELAQHEITWSDTLDNSVDWSANAYKALSKRFKTAPEDFKQRQKCQSFLYQRGFTNEQIRNALDEFCQEK
ncbi:MAG: regulatory protein RecX [bacterium]